ncbi:unnamed protein product [Adineta ricciae]|uniref:Mono(ADP-ribosyl)transferase n=1 Tax=Adineta ricciae TaxID=249248 RepID=A0A816DJC3_ADIRI|nr:unnamed protein product [Adineta ricciae]CAF1635463.1 unnamed protein product [Adineta ricciae]
MSPERASIATLLMNTEECPVETFSVTWIDQHVNDAENVETLERLHSHINFVKVFEKPDECQKYLRKMSPYDRTILIASGSLGKQLVPDVEILPQVSSIYIFCTVKEIHEVWANNYPKVRSVLTEYDELIDAVIGDYRLQVKQDGPIAYNILKKEVPLNLSNSFIRPHLLINYLLRLESNSNDKEELFTFCHDQYRHNAAELRTLHQLEHNYSPDKALTWYTLDGFPYQMLNKALRTQHVHLLFLYRFWIKDIYQQLLQHQCKTSIHAFRGQYMTTSELQLFQNAIGEVICINSFFSTSTDVNVALNFIDDAEGVNAHLHRVLFDIHADPPVNTTKPFANIREFSLFGDEEEVLFSMNSSFRVVDVDTNTDGILVIELKFCRDDDIELQPIFNLIIAECRDEEISLIRFANFLFDMKYFKETEVYYLRCLQLSTGSLSDKCACYEQLSCLALRKNRFELSLNWQKQSHEMKLNLHEPNSVDLARSCFKLAEIYEKLNNYPEALTHYKLAHGAFRYHRHSHGLQLNKCRRKMGQIYSITGKYSDALKYHKKVLKSWTQPDTSVDESELGKLYYEIGYVYHKIQVHDKAILNYNSALKVYQKCISPEHKYIADVFEKIAIVYRNQGVCIQSLLYYEKAQQIYQKYLPARHPYLTRIDATIRNIQAQLKHDPVEETV